MKLLQAILLMISELFTKISCFFFKSKTINSTAESDSVHSRSRNDSWSIAEIMKEHKYQDILA